MRSNTSLCARQLIYSTCVTALLLSGSALTTMLFQYNEKGWDQYANAIILFIVLVVISLNAIVNKVTEASIDKGIGD